MLNQKIREEISLFLFKKYGNFSLCLIKKIIAKYPNNNSIIYINNKKDEEIIIIGKIFKFLTLLIKNLNENYTKKKNINDHDIIFVIIELIKFIIHSFENILNDKEKYYLIRRIDNEIN